MPFVQMCDACQSVLVSPLCLCQEAARGDRACRRSAEPEKGTLTSIGFSSDSCLGCWLRLVWRFGPRVSFFMYKTNGNNSTHPQVMTRLPPSRPEDSMRGHSWCSGSVSIVEAPAMIPPFCIQCPRKHFTIISSPAWHGPSALPINFAWETMKPSQTSVEHGAVYSPFGSHCPHLRCLLPV